VVLTINNQDHVMRLTLGSLAALEARLGADSLIDLVTRFETGKCRSADVIALLAAGLAGAGHPMAEADLACARIQGGPTAAASAAAALLALAFSPPQLS
jgi:hypothetical protein